MKDLEELINRLKESAGKIVVPAELDELKELQKLVSDLDALISKLKQERGQPG